MFLGTDLQALRVRKSEFPDRRLSRVTWRAEAEREDGNRSERPEFTATRLRRAPTPVAAHSY